MLVDISVVKNLPASAGDAASIPGLGRCPGRKEWQRTPVFLPEKKIPWTEKPGVLQSCKESDTTEQLNIHTQAWRAQGSNVCRV